MPRKRDLDPGVWRSEQFLALPDDSARLTFLALISLADDLGVGRVSDVLRYTSLSPHGALTESAASTGMVLLFKDDDDRLLYLLPNWCRYQHVNRPSKSDLQIPANWADFVPPKYHGRFSERSVSPHGVLSEPPGAPSPSPSPSPREPIGSSSANAEKEPRRIGACPQSDNGQVEWFVTAWNKEAQGRNVRKMRDTPKPTSTRYRRIRDFVKAAQQPKAVVASIRAMLGAKWLEERSDPLDVDWFVRPCHRDKHLEAGQDLIDQNNQRPASGPASFRYGWEQPK